MTAHLSHDVVSEKMRWITIALCLLASAAQGQVTSLTQEEGRRRFGGLALHNVDFQQMPYTNVLAEINRRLTASNIAVRLDFSPTRYFAPSGNSRIAEEAIRLVRKVRVGSDWWADSLEGMKDGPLLTWREEKVNLLQFLTRSTQQCGFLMALRFRENAILLAPGPGKKECRAFRFGTNSVTRLRRIAGGRITTGHFVFDSLWHTNRMTWLDSESILLRVDTPQNLDRFELILKDIGDAQRVFLGQQECTTPISAP